jgi:hypothetical protein
MRAGPSVTLPAEHRLRGRDDALYGKPVLCHHNSDAGGQAGDQPFHDQTLAAVPAYQAAGGNPDDLIVQSWYPFPTAIVTEDEPNTCTNTGKGVIAEYDALYP